MYFLLKSLSHVHFSVFSLIMRSSGMSAVTACAAVRDRIHSSSWNSLVVGVFFFLQEHELRTEEGATLFQEISCDQLDCQDVWDSEEPSSLSTACEGNDGNQMFMSLKGPGALMGANLTWRSDAMPVLLAPLLSQSIAGFPCVCLQTRLLARLESVLCLWGAYLARSSGNQSRSPVHSVFCRARCCSTHESLHGFAD